MESQSYPSSPGIYAAAGVCWLALIAAVTLPKNKQTVTIAIESLQMVAITRSFGLVADSSVYSSLILPDVTHFKFMDYQLSSMAPQRLLGYYLELIPNLYIFLICLGVLALLLGIVWLGWFQHVVKTGKTFVRTFMLGFTPVIYNLFLSIKFKDTGNSGSLLKSSIIAAVFLVILISLCVSSFSSFSEIPSRTVSMLTQECHAGMKQIKSTIIKFWITKASFIIFLAGWAVFHDEKANASNYSLVMAITVLYVIIVAILRPCQLLTDNILLMLCNMAACGILVIGILSLQTEPELKNYLVPLTLSLEGIIVLAATGSLIRQHYVENSENRLRNHDDPLPTEANVAQSEPIQSARSPPKPLKSALKKNRVFVTTAHQDTAAVVFDRLSPPKRSPPATEVTLTSPPNRSPGSFNNSPFTRINPLSGMGRFGKRHPTPPPNRLNFGGRQSNLP